ncbi:MAG: hypothetical protein WAS07_11995 [Micropruina sp.]
MTVKFVAAMTCENHDRLLVDFSDVGSDGPAGKVQMNGEIIPGQRSL